MQRNRGFSTACNALDHQKIRVEIANDQILIALDRFHNGAHLWRCVLREQRLEDAVAHCHVCIEEILELTFADLVLTLARNLSLDASSRRVVVRVAKQETVKHAGDR